jgi:general secretion pathway protein L
MEAANSDLWQRIRGTARRAGFSAFWSWWIGQLAPLIPEPMHNAVQRRRLRPVLVFGADAAVLWVPSLADGHLAYGEAARVALSADEAAVTIAGRTAIEGLSPVAKGGRAGPVRIVIALAASQVLRKTITLPAAVEDNLAQALAYDLDRHTPFKPDEMYFDAIVVGRDPAKRQIRVDWAAALRTLVDQMRRRAESWGATVVAVTPASTTGALPLSGPVLNLLPGAGQAQTSSRRRWEIWVPLALIAAAALFATALPLWQKRGYAIALLQQAGQARAQADASGALRDELERLTGDYNFALQKKYAYPTALQSVEEVSKLLPDDTWLTQFELKNTAKGKEPRREILLRGESANAGHLVSLFEASRLFEQAAPRSPTTKIQPGPGEIFDLGAQLKLLPPPQPLEFATGGDGEAMPAASAPAPIPAVPVTSVPMPAKPAAPEPAAAQAAERRDDAPAPAGATPAAPRRPAVPPAVTRRAAVPPAATPEAATPPAVAPPAAPPEAAPPEAAPPEAAPPEAAPPEAAPPEAAPPEAAPPEAAPPEAAAPAAEGPR